jgi:hypothetical protein
MLSIPDELMFNTQPVEYVLRHAEDGIDGLDGGLAQEGEPGHTEQRVEGVRHVPRPVSKPARLSVLKQKLLLPPRRYQLFASPALRYLCSLKYNSYC